MKLQSIAGVASLGRVCLVFLGIVALGGCESIEVGLGMRMRLDKVPVTALSATLSPDPGLAPGKSGRLIITATTSDAKQLVTVGAGHGNVLFDSFTFVASTVTMNKSGVVSLSADPRVGEGAMPHIQIAVVGHPDVTADLSIPVRYDVAFIANFAGRTGLKGIDGSDGFAGSSGSNGTIDFTNPSAGPSAGGQGGNGTNGEDGRDGDSGQPGEEVHVWMTLKGGDHPLLQVRAASSQHARLFLIDPNGGSLTVDTSGGEGGAGGSGGRGGRGGSGGSGLPPGFSGQDGRDGSNGHAGSNGAGGIIIVSVDSEAQPYLSKLHLINKSGSGAPGPKPEIRIEAVPPIW
jgi:hypothetical protein